MSTQSSAHAIDEIDERSVTFDWQNMFSLYDLSHDYALDLVRTLLEWSFRRQARGKGCMNGGSASSEAPPRQ